MIIYHWIIGNKVFCGKGLYNLDAVIIYSIYDNDIYLNISDEQGEFTLNLERQLDIQEAIYEWVFVRAETESVSGVIDGDNMYDAALADGKGSGTIIKNNGEYTIQSQLEWEALPQRLPSGEEIYLAVDNEITNIEELYAGDQNAVFYRTLVLFVNSYYEIEYLDSKRNYHQ